MSSSGVSERFLQTTQVANVLGPAGHTGFAAKTQLCHCRVKAADVHTREPVDVSPENTIHCNRGRGARFASPVLAARALGGAAPGRRLPAAGRGLEAGPLAGSVLPRHRTCSHCRTFSASVVK